MPQFRKKPVVIDAFQWNRHLTALIDWLRPFPGDPLKWNLDDRTGAVLIPTLEGVMKADVGDWIIRGVQGEYYPCKPDIFAATYEPVNVELPF